MRRHADGMPRPVQGTLSLGRPIPLGGLKYEKLNTKNLIHDAKGPEQSATVTNKRTFPGIHCPSGCLHVIQPLFLGIYARGNIMVYCQLVNSFEVEKKKSRSS